MEVAMIIARMKLDNSSIVTALLHDTVEDTLATIEDIQKLFGKEIGRLVNGVTKLTKIENQQENVRQAENFRKFLLAMSEDIRVLIVKLADRLHNMRTLSFCSSVHKRYKIAKETMDIYAPLAERIGIRTIKEELADIAFKELYPEIHRSIVSRLSYLREGGYAIVDKTVEHLSKLLEQYGITASVCGREKTPYSIWHKIEMKSISFEQLSDIVAFRILVNDTLDCYNVLGVIHSNYHMVPGSFKDFISTPKDNRYQSLHTVVMGPAKQAIEIQIRTYAMHDVAELGVASHWQYKQGITNITQDESRQFRWLRELISILENNSDAEDFLENTKLEIYYDQVFCFSPKGKLIVLPKGATPVDFAYAIHSEVGHSCVGAKINGLIMPLSTVLNNGDQVDIIRSNNHVPSPSWEKFIVTGKARSEVKRFIRTHMRDEFIKLGQAILSKLLKQAGKKELDGKLKSDMLEYFGKKTIEDFYVSLGEGNVNHKDVLNLFSRGPLKMLRDKLSFLRFSNSSKNDDEKSSVPIKGLSPGMAVHFSECCSPIPGDRIVGIMDKGQGVNIHTIDCDSIREMSVHRDGWIDCSWDDDTQDKKYVARIKIALFNEIGSLSTLSGTLAQEGVNITNFKIIARNKDFFEICMDIEVRGVQHLSNIIGLLRSKDCLHFAERYKVNL
jgi:GTP pyrophosphokinase